MDDNGLPVLNQFPARDLHEINKFHEENELANLLYVIMAQPLQDNASSFMLCTFGQADFNYMTCIKRINFIKEQLAEHDICVLGWSSDGDPKLLKAMQIFTKMGYQENSIPTCFQKFLNVDLSAHIVCIQDESHICNKLKNRLMVPSEPIVMGYNGKKACMSDLLLLDQQKLKAKTQLTQNDLINVDRMSTKQALKLASNSVIDTLKEVDNEGTKATRLYLFLIKEQHLALYAKDLTPSQRVFKIWFVVFILRAIRNERSEFQKYIKDFKTSQFITLNAYKCIELNAANLLIIARKLRDSNEEKYFLPWLYQSQTCEAYFRLLRSFTPNQSTMTNFYGLEGQHKMERTQTMIDLGLILSEKGFTIPIKHKTNINVTTNKNLFYIPDDNTLVHEIKSALDEAKRILADFLVRPDNTLPPTKIFELDVSLYQVLYSKSKKNVQNENIDEEDPDEDRTSIIIDYENDDESLEDVMADPVMVSDIDLLTECEGILSKSCPGKSVEGSNYLSLKDETGAIFFISIRTYVWLLNNPQKLSNDRVTKFRSTSTKVNEYFRKEDTNFEKLNEIMKLDFIILKGRIAQIMDFRYINIKGKQTIGNVTYKNYFVPILRNDNDSGHKGASESSIGLLVNFFKLVRFQNDFVLHRSSTDCNEQFIDRKYYETHIPLPKYNQGKKLYSLEIGEKILKLVKTNQ